MDNQREKAGNPFKSSLFGKNAGIDALEKHFNVSKNNSHDHRLGQNLRALIIEVLNSSKDEQAFKKKLKKEGFQNSVERVNIGKGMLCECVSKSMEY